MKHSVIPIAIGVVSLAVSVLGAVLAQGSDQPLPPGDSPPPTVFDRIKQVGPTQDFDSALAAPTTQTGAALLSFFAPIQRRLVL